MAAILHRLMQLPPPSSTIVITSNGDGVRGAEPLPFLTPLARARPASLCARFYAPRLLYQSRRFRGSLPCIFAHTYSSLSTRHTTAKQWYRCQITVERTDHIYQQIFDARPHCHLARRRHAAARDGWDTLLSTITHVECLNLNDQNIAVFRPIRSTVRHLPRSSGLHWSKCV